MSTLTQDCIDMLEEQAAHAITAANVYRIKPDEFTSGVQIRHHYDGLEVSHNLTWYCALLLAAANRLRNVDGAGE